MKKFNIIITLLSFLLLPLASRASSLYVACQNGETGSWTGGFEMTPNDDGSSWSIEIKLAPYSYFFISESSIADSNDSQFWNEIKATCYGPDVNDLDLSSKLGETVSVIYANGNCFSLRRPGTYTITISSLASSPVVSVQRAESTQLEGSDSTTYFDGIGYQGEDPATPTLPCYYIPHPAGGTSTADKVIRASHSHHSADITYAWVKFDNRFQGYTQQWYYYYSDDHIPAADTSTIALINSHEDFASLSPAQIEQRRHAVNMTSGPNHDCRNFSSAHYRLYGYHPTHPDAPKASARSRKSQPSPRDVRPQSATAARVAYTLPVADNTTAVDPITVDPVDPADPDGLPGEPQYYNLQGIRIPHPVPGQIYILRQGPSATKHLAP